MTQTEHRHAADVPRESSEAAEWLRSHAVVLAAAALIAAQLWWKAHLLGHFYFRQDDFQFMDQALASPFSLKYLFTIQGGHLRPGGLAIIWVLVRLSLYDWTLVSSVTVVLLAAAGLAMLRLLLLLFGRRPFILVPLALFLFSPLELPGLSFWTTTLLWLPLQLAMLMALGSHVKYLRSGRLRHAIGTTAWLACGMLFDEQGVLVPVLVFAVTSAYFVPGDWLSAARTALRSHWRAWVLYGTLTVGYLVLFLVKLASSVQQPGKPGVFSGVLTLASTMLRVSFPLAAVGGPWRWYAPGRDYGYVVESAPLIEIAWALAVVLVVASLWYRRHALRAWIMLAGWLLLADLLPVIVSRASAISATILGLDLHYLADAAPVLAVCLGLAFWPVVGEQRPYRARRPPQRLLVPAVCILVACFLASSVWSGISYLRDTSSAVTRSYIATASAALAKAPPGTVILSGITPHDVMYHGYLGAAAQTSRVLGPLAPKSSGIKFTAQPAGLISNLMMFNSAGQLMPAADVGDPSVSPPARTGCWRLQPGTTAIPLQGAVFDYGWIVRLAYSGGPATVQLRLGTGERDAVLPAGAHDVYVPVTGAGRGITIRRLSPGPATCVSGLTVGLIYAVKGAHPLPLYALP